MASTKNTFELLFKITSAAAEAEAAQGAVIQHLKEENEQLKEELRKLKDSLAAPAAAAAPAATAACAAAAAAAPAAAAAAAPAAAAEAPQPVKTTLPVFCTADSGNLTSGHMHVSDFDKVIAFSYALKKDLGPLFETMSEKDFKEYLKTLHRCDNGDPITGHYAGKIYAFMKTAKENIGKQIVVAVDRPFGGGLEIREITGPYCYSEGVRYTHGGSGYFHQFPTKLIRKLTPKESNEVVEARKAQSPRGLNWSVDLVV